MHKSAFWGVAPAWVTLLEGGAYGQDRRPDMEQRMRERCGGNDHAGRTNSRYTNGPGVSNTSDHE